MEKIIILLLFLIIIGNLALYWLFFGQPKLKKKLKGETNDGKIFSR